MKNKRFETLRDGLLEAKAVLDGKIEPSREFVRSMPANRKTKKTPLWGVYVGTDEDLTPMKVYRLHNPYQDRIAVIDEEGESVICLLNEFVVLEVSPEVNQIFDSAEMLELA